MSDRSCKLVYPLSYGQKFPIVFHVFFKNVTRMYEFLSFLLLYVGYGLLINFPVFIIQCFFFSENFAVNLYPVKVVAQAFE